MANLVVIEPTGVAISYIQAIASIPRYVIRGDRVVSRTDEPGTWISPDIHIVEINAVTTIFRDNIIGKDIVC